MLTQLKTAIIAEVGLNHNGDFELARNSVIAASEAGCDAVKFQNFSTEDFLSDRTQLFTYLSQGKEITEPFFDICKRNEFKKEWLVPLKSLCDDLGVEFISTPTSEEGVQELKNVGCKYVKNGSDYLTHISLISTMAKSGMTVIISTGMGDHADIDAAVLALGEAYPEKTIILHCTSAYPTEPIDVNLNRMVELRRVYQTAIGYSDHTEGYLAAVQAVTLGASVIEKHFTLDHNLPGPDHWFSLSPTQMVELVAEIRNAEIRIGSSDLSPAAGELKNREIFRIGVIAEHDFEKGHVLQYGDYTFRKPCSGILPRDIKKYVGCTVSRSVKKGSSLHPKDFFSKG